jgi:hypothetical protein
LPLEPIDLPTLEEMPGPEADENPIEFQSFVTEAAFMKSVDLPMIETRATPVTPATPAKLSGTPGRKPS